MSKVLVEEGNLTNIANAIRTKSNTTATYKPGEMAAAISNLSTSTSTSTYVPTDEDLTFRDCISHCLFTGNQFSWIFNNYKDKKIRFTGDCWDTQSLFYRCEQEDLSNVIFEDCYGSSPVIDGGLGLAGFLDSAKAKYLPEIKNCNIQSLVSAFRYSDGVKTLPSFENCTIAYSGGYIPINQMIYSLQSLEDVNFDLSKTIILRNTDQYNAFYREFISECWHLKSVVFSLPMVQESPVTYNQFPRFVTRCYSLRHLKFKNYLPSLQMKSQVIDMSDEIGCLCYSGDDMYFPDSFPLDKKITDDASYQALKDDPDAWTKMPEYSFYNHDSAVETINSLPDTSAYLAENGGTNTINFLGNSGSNTDGGAINTMTAEEIAVATAKGWTVTFSSIE